DGLHPLVLAGRLKRYGSLHVSQPCDPHWRIVVVLRAGESRECTTQHQGGHHKRAQLDCARYRFLHEVDHPVLAYSKPSRARTLLTSLDPGAGLSRNGGRILPEQCLDAFRKSHSPTVICVESRRDCSNSLLQCRVHYSWNRANFKLLNDVLHSGHRLEKSPAVVVQVEAQVSVAHNSGECKWKTSRSLRCWSGDVSPEMRLPGRKSCKRITGVSTTSA